MNKRCSCLSSAAQSGFARLRPLLQPRLLHSFATGLVQLPRVLHYAADLFRSNQVRINMPQLKSIPEGLSIDLTSFSSTPLLSPLSSSSSSSNSRLLSLFLLVPLLLFCVICQPGLAHSAYNETCPWETGWSGNHFIRFSPPQVHLSCATLGTVAFNSSAAPTALRHLNWHLIRRRKTRVINLQNSTCQTELWI